MTYKISALFAVCLMLISSLMLTACDNDDDNNTNQYTGGVSLNVFGPCPVARGGELRFLGSGMDQITRITLPGAGDITDIKVIGKNEIRITVPQTAMEGLVVLHSPKGEIKTKTPITYSEPVSIDDFSPKSVKAGETITITGEYLNLIKEVIFADGVVVDEFTSQSRKEIKVVVPAEAQTGKFIVSDRKEIPNWIYSEEELAVTLPAIASIAPNPLKVGQILTITGTDFDLVSEVLLPGIEKGVEVTGATDKIEVETPAEMKEGKVILVAKSGVEIMSGELVLVKPVIASISSANVKNNTEFSIKGKDLDLVSQVSFSKKSDDPENPEYVVVDEFASQTATQIVLVLPATAVDGAFILGTKSETETKGQVLTFAKPAVTNFSAISIKANEDLTLTGTNLDLVTGIDFGGVLGTIVSATNTGLTVTVPVGAQTGPLKLTTDSGTELITTQELTIDVVLPVITSIESEGPGKKITATGTDMGMIKTIYLEDKSGGYTIKVTDYGVKTDTKVEFYHVLGAATGYITPMMVTFDGDEGYMPKVYCNGTDPITDPALVIDDFEPKNGHDAGWDNWGSAMEVINENGNHYLKLSSGISGWKWIFGCNHQSTRGDFPSLDDASKYSLKLDIKVVGKLMPDVLFQFKISGKESNTTSFLTAKDNFTTNGNWITVTKSLAELGINGSVEGSGEWGLMLNSGTIPVGVEVSIDNIRFEKTNN